MSDANEVDGNSPLLQLSRFQILRIQNSLTNNKYIIKLLRKKQLVKIMLCECVHMHKVFASPLHLLYILSYSIPIPADLTFCLPFH